MQSSRAAVFTGFQFCNAAYQRHASLNARSLQERSEPIRSWAILSAIELHACATRLNLPLADHFLHSHDGSRQVHPAATRLCLAVSWDHISGGVSEVFEAGPTHRVFALSEQVAERCLAVRRLCDSGATRLARQSRAGSARSDRGGSLKRLSRSETRRRAITSVRGRLCARASCGSAHGSASPAVPWVCVRA